MMSMSEEIPASFPASTEKVTFEWGGSVIWWIHL